MAKCDACGQTIVLGGKKVNDLVYCNDKCYQAGLRNGAAQYIPPDLLEAEVKKIHQGSCPRCGGAGPVDLHMSHQVTSMLYLTTRKTKPQLSCQPCGRKRQIGAAVYTFFLGWWGFPWGLIFTPVYIYRNIAGILKPPDPATPSGDLWDMVRLNLAQQILNEQAAAARASQPPMPPIPSPGV